MSLDSPIECVADVHAVLGEGPVWVARENALYWLDIKGLKIFRLDDRGQVSEWPTPFRVGSIAPTRRGGQTARLGAIPCMVCSPVATAANGLSRGHGRAGSAAMPV